MNIIDNMRLALVFTLLTQEDRRSISIDFKNNKDMVSEFAEDVMRPFLTHKQLRKERHYTTISNEHNVFISIPSNENTIEKTFIEYLEACSRNEITSLTKNVYTWDRQVRAFEQSIEKGINLSNVHFDTTEHLHVIAKAYYDNKIKINSIAFEIDGNMMANKKNPLYVYCDEYGEYQYNSDFTNYFFKCSIDMTNYYDKVENIKTQNKKPMLKDLILNDIDKLVKKRGLNNTITLYDLREIYSNHTENKLKAHSRNKQLENYVSAYRKEKATTLTLDRKLNDEYFIIKNEKKIK